MGQAVCPQPRAVGDDYCESPQIQSIRSLINTPTHPTDVVLTPARRLAPIFINYSCQFVCFKSATTKKSFRLL